MAPSLGIVVPAYRPDPDRLAAYVRALDDRLAPAVIRIELDAPESGVPAALADLPATVATAPERRGKGAAVTAGFEALSTDLLCFVDADGSTPAASVEAVLAPLVAGRAGVAVGSRRHPEASVASHQTFARRRLGDAFAWLARRLLDAPLYDYQCGAKALTREAWTAVREHLYEPGFAWDVELVAMAGALDLEIAEVAIRWEDQPGSTVSPVGTALSLSRALVSVRHRARQLQESPVHGAIAARRRQPVALVDRSGARAGASDGAASPASTDGAGQRDGAGEGNDAGERAGTGRWVGADGTAGDADETDAGAGEGADRSRSASDG